MALVVNVVDDDFPLSFVLQFLMKRSVKHQWLSFLWQVLAILCTGLKDSTCVTSSQVIVLSANIC